ncbi:accessory Sec system glycosyltransferase GtfA [Limosilactobacillus equigenerosi]|uniref:accessory Sec system glycosyltransferase GtfA n=1 Tax=Limosilactobacillus equigenerosi TaxID=417373 RepID=UPI0006D052BE|nr:accessory Sec system glycosyltransferase GtfA [Limosilactobacillus equigenerosi]
MTVYNFNQGIGWASSGVEYAQSYRAKCLRDIGCEAKFIFTDFISITNLANLTSNLGFENSEIIWLYLAFTDFTIQDSSYSINELTQKFSKPIVQIEELENKIRYFFSNDSWALVCRDDVHRECVGWVEYVVKNSLVRKDFYSSGRYMTEYYAPINNKATLLQRDFLNHNGSIAYTEIPSKTGSVYRFDNELVTSKSALITRFIKQLKLTENDVVLIDRSTGMAQQILENKGKAKVGSVVHAEHFSEDNTDNDHILWNNYYEYVLQHANYLNFIITATKAQKDILIKQLNKYGVACPPIYVIPVGNLKKINPPKFRSDGYKMMSASRLASEKHLDWLIMAVYKVHAKYSNLKLDIYGEGPERDKLAKLIQTLGADEYIKLLGHHDLTNVYKNYQIYGSASTSEGFGLTLMEAVGSSLAMLGLNVRYGNQTFIKDDINGRLVSYDKSDNVNRIVELLTEGLVDILNNWKLFKYEKESYNLAKNFSESVVSNQWKKNYYRI